MADGLQGSFCDGLDRQQTPRRNPFKAAILGVEKYPAVAFFLKALGAIPPRLASVHVVPRQDAIAVDDLAGPVGKPRSSFTGHTAECTMRDARIQAKNGGAFVESAYV